MIGGFPVGKTVLITGDDGKTPIQLLTYEINTGGIVISSPIDSSGFD